MFSIFQQCLDFDEISEAMSSDSRLSNNGVLSSYGVSDEMLAVQSAAGLGVYRQTSGESPLQAAASGCTHANEEDHDDLQLDDADDDDEDAEGQLTELCRSCCDDVSVVDESWNKDLKPQIKSSIAPPIFGFDRFRLGAECWNLLPSRKSAGAEDMEVSGQDQTMTQQFVLDYLAACGYFPVRQPEREKPLFKEFMWNGYRGAIRAYRTMTLGSRRQRSCPEHLKHYLKILASETKEQRVKTNWLACTQAKTLPLSSSDVQERLTQKCFFFPFAHLQYDIRIFPHLFTASGKKNTDGKLASLQDMQLNTDSQHKVYLVYWPVHKSAV